MPTDLSHGDPLDRLAERLDSLLERVVTFQRGLSDWKLQAEMAGCVILMVLFVRAVYSTDSNWARLGWVVLFGIAVDIRDQISQIRFTRKILAHTRQTFKDEWRWR